MATRASQAMRELVASGGLADFRGDRFRLFVRVQRQLATGRAVSPDDVVTTVADLNLAPEAAFAYLEPRTEHNTDGHIVGAGITLNPTPHRYTNDDAQVFAWCALDTLLFPILLEQTGRVESTSPVSSATVRLSVGPAGVADSSPAEAVISLPVVDAGQTDTSSVEAIWRTFCHRSYFFASRAEAESWAEGREGVEIASVEEGFVFAREVAEAFTA